MNFLIKNVKCSFVMTLILILTSGTAFAQREYSKECKKIAHETAKKQAKQIEKEKWQYDGTLTLQYELEQYNLDIMKNCGDSRAIPPQNITANSISLARKNATLNQIQVLAIEMKTEALGEIETQHGQDDEFSSNKMAAKYKGELSACLQECFYVYKTTPNGKYTVRVYYKVDKERFEKLCSKVRNDYEDDDKRSKAIRESVMEAFEE